MKVRTAWIGVLLVVVVTSGCVHDTLPEKVQVVETIEVKPEARPEYLKNFQNSLEEYQRCLESERAARTRVDGETWHVRSYFAHGEMCCAYGLLNEPEKLAIFSGDQDDELPTGIRLDQGSYMNSVLGYDLTTGSKRRDFEDSLSMSYMEVDYMTAFEVDISRVKGEYCQTLQERELLFCWENCDYWLGRSD